MFDMISPEKPFILLHYHKTEKFSILIATKEILYTIGKKTVQHQQKFQYQQVLFMIDQLVR
jgi:hypothetical protein